MSADAIRCDFCKGEVVYVRFVSREVSGYQCLYCGRSFGPEITSRYTWGRYLGRFAATVLPRSKRLWQG
jgi:hypothetical protein